MYKVSVVISFTANNDNREAYILCGWELNNWIIIVNTFDLKKKVLKNSDIISVWAEKEKQNVDWL